MEDRGLRRGDDAAAAAAPTNNGKWTTKGKEPPIDVIAQWVDMKAAENMNSRAAIADAKRLGSRSPLSRSSASLPRPPSDELQQLIGLASDLQNAQKAAKLSDVADLGWVHWGFCAACSTVGAAYGIGKAVWNNLPSINSGTSTTSATSRPLGKSSHTKFQEEGTSSGRSEE